MMGYQGVKFDETGQNILAATYLIQLHGQESTSWCGRRRPQTPSCDWPMTGWAK